MTVEGKVAATNVVGNSTGTTLINRNPYLYRGYRYDRETGLYYLNSRYYDPETGRFLNADVFVSTGQGVLGNNMFAYCLNNPVNRIDDSGTIAYPGEIHQAVIEEIVKRHDGMIAEIRIDYPKGKYGRADLVHIYTGETWELKPAQAHYINKALTQVEKYVSNRPHNKDYSDLELSKGHYLPPGKFRHQSVDGEYIVSYWWAEDGVILYRYVISQSVFAPVLEKGFAEEHSTKTTTMVAAFGVGIATGFALTGGGYAERISFSANMFQ